MISILTDAQAAAIKRVRSRAWNRPFTVVPATRQVMNDVYDAEALVGNPVIVSGDYTFQDQLEMRGNQGGQEEHAEIQLACDLDTLSLFMPEGTTLLVQNIPYTIVRVTGYATSGECVITARRSH